ncbi:MAG: glycoside hydrolase N-terminal domain-containing protein [Oscillospiraceae bacterium]|jgi:alpha-L-fucosidase 2|nr:glycoside hydrolase N-terminal domain-containing protein [Oscillospiraceae bacterium]
MMILSDKNPPASWQEGLPAGNGRLAAMVWGDGRRDILDLNHEWLWRGVNRGREIVPAAERLELVRGWLKQGDYARAALAANLFFAGNGGLLPGSRVDPYQTAGMLTFETAVPCRFLRRVLDMENAVVRITRETENTELLSEVFVDCHDGVIWAKWQSKERFSGSLSLSRAEDARASTRFSVTETGLRLDCVFDGGLSHSVAAKVETDGACAVSGQALEISGASVIVCAVNIGVSVCNLEAELRKYAVSLSDYDNIFRAHAQKFTRVMGAVQFSLDDAPPAEDPTTAGMLERFREGGSGSGLMTAYFHFGRYLMAASSVCAELPANLQGKWNNLVAPPWDCDYHFDINLQMNYWMAEPCGMPECAEALLKYLERFRESGAEAAGKLYGCRGMILPLMSDAWAKSTPESFGWAVWIGAAAWFCRHFWDRYRYSGDICYLRDRGYPFIRAAAEFYEDYLTEDKNGVLQIMPSQSPENTFAEAGGFMPVGICVSSAMDVQLAYDALGFAAEAAEALGVDAERAKRWQSMRKKLPGFRIGRDGRLLEWGAELTESEPGHRHLSHLYGVYPSELFTAETRIAQFEAARKSLAFRLSAGGGHTGWSRAWVACLQARFGDGEGFYQHLSALIRDFTTVTLLDLHPPGIFQIDGNLGAVAAVIEAIISYTDGKVHLLRALPEAWPSGRLSGIKIPGGHTVSLRWRNGKAAELRVGIGFEKAVTVRFPDGSERRFEGREGEERNFEIPRRL